MNHVNVTDWQLILSDVMIQPFNISTDGSYGAIEDCTADSKDDWLVPGKFNYKFKYSEYHVIWIDGILLIFQLLLDQFSVDLSLLLSLLTLLDAENIQTTMKVQTENQWDKTEFFFT